MSWNGVERRSQDQCLRAVMDALAELKDNQKAIHTRLDTIEKSVTMAEGAWWFTRYVLAPLFGTVVAGIVFMWERISATLHTQ